MNDAGTRLLFKFRSGTHGLNEELGRQREREGKKECVLCGGECHVLCVLELTLCRICGNALELVTHTLKL